MILRTLIHSSAACICLATGAAAQSGADFNGDGFADLAVDVSGEDIGSIVDAGVAHIVYGTANGLRSTGTQLWSQQTSGIADAAEAADQLSVAATGNFNGDAYDDLVLYVAEDLPGKPNAGAIHVLYGSATGLRSSGSQFWTQDTAGVADAAESGDFFGAPCAAGDFNNDGRDDLAIGVPCENFGTISNAGGVHVLYGSTIGLRTLQSQFFTQNTAGVADNVEADDTFGSSLCSGDFDGDGFADLAIGVIGENVGDQSMAGALHVLHGSNLGLTATGNQFWHQNSPGVANAAQANDLFGAVTRSGDFNNDGFDDLAIGAPGQSIGGVTFAGAFHVLYGSANGLRTLGSQFWSQNSPGILDQAELNDRFGDALATGDFNNDGFDDLLVGVAREDVGSIIDAGAIQIMLGGASGLRYAGNRVWTQDSTGIVDLAETGDQFGSALVVGDFNGDGRDDVAIAINDEDVGSALNCGAMAVIAGAASGLTSAGDQFWHQNSPGIPEVSESSDESGQ